MYLQINNLTKSFDNHCVVNNLSLELPKGKILCLLGPSGCGKTTTLKMIGGFLKADSGSIIIDGVDITSLPPDKRPVSTVFQSYALFPHMNVLENVTYGLKFKKLSKSEIISTGEKYLKIVGLSEHKKKKVHELSGGQKQRVALARALITKPKLLLLDEPLSNLDANLRVLLREEIKRIQKEFDMTMVFVTHDQEEAFGISSTVGIMDEGYLVQMGSPVDIYEKPQSKFVLDFIGDSNIIKSENLTMYVRPEQIILNRHTGQHKGKILKKTYLGSIILYDIQYNTNILRAQVQNISDKNYDVGDKIYLDFNLKTL